ncbi:MAG: DegT/DnrJ/EryC1/StrS family aminotransferase, partial [Myxococcota bacterium]
MIPFLDLAAATNELRHELDAAYQRVLDRNWFILGSEVRAFEEEFAEFVGANHCIGVANGLDALTVTLRCLGIGQGDEVIAPANTFIATWLAVARTGATVVGCDVDAGTLNMTASDVRPHITERTKAILPVHLYGQPVDAAAFDDLENETNVPVVYDAAQAHGATFDATPIGAFGAASTWSFYPGKNLGCLGDGGAITTNDDALAEELRVRRNYGSRVKYVHQVAGTNSRLDEL